MTPFKRLTKEEMDIATTWSAGTLRYALEAAYAEIDRLQDEVDANELASRGFP